MGRVRNYVRTGDGPNGWMVITMAAQGQEYFFHRTGLTSSLNIETLIPNQRVSFEVENSDKGPRASQVRSA